MAGHVSNLSLFSGPSGPRLDRDVAEGQPVAAGLEAMIVYDGVMRPKPV